MMLLYQPSTPLLLFKKVSYLTFEGLTIEITRQDVSITFPGILTLKFYLEMMNVSSLINNMACLISIGHVFSIKRSKYWNKRTATQIQHKHYR
jgi:hypothetical protein